MKTKIPYLLVLILALAGMMLLAECASFGSGAGKGEVETEGGGDDDSADDDIADDDDIDDDECPLPNNGMLAVWGIGSEEFRTHVITEEQFQQLIELFEGVRQGHPMGVVWYGEEYNCGWSWHIVPISVQIVELSMEICDGLPSMIEQDVEYWVENVRVYCPWGATLSILWDCRSGECIKYGSSKN